MSRHDDHYKELPIEPIDIVLCNFTYEEKSGYLVGSVLKYIMRYKKKGGLRDLEKGLSFLEWLIDVERKLIEEEIKSERRKETKDNQGNGKDLQSIPVSD